MPIESIAGALNLNEQQMNYNSIVNEQIRVVEQDTKAREVRPVENAGDGSKAKAGKRDETTTKTIIDDQKIIVFTRYDSEGNEINKVPPGYDKMG